MPVDRVGEYVVKGLIGEGGMGVVYEGLQPVIGKRVAIKLLKKDFAQDPEEARRLLEEARSVNQIGHRGIIDIFSFGTLPDGRQYFVMEYMVGVPLSQHVKKHAPLLPQDVLQIVDEIAAALGAAHNAGVIHRDLKPSNVFLVSSPDGSSYVKLLDFGLAKQAQFARGETPQTRASRVLGTPEFMAPEQARAEPVGPKTDLYALGVVTYEMLTGSLPFDAPTAFEIVNMHLNVPPEPPSSREESVPPELDQLVLKLLEKSASDRPPTAEVVRQEIKRIRKVLNLNATRLAIPVSTAASGVKPKLPPAPRMPGEQEFTWTPSSQKPRRKTGAALQSVMVDPELKDPNPTREAPRTDRVDADLPTRSVDRTARVEPPVEDDSREPTEAGQPAPQGAFRARLKSKPKPEPAAAPSKLPWVIVIVAVLAVGVGAYLFGKRSAATSPESPPAAKP